MLKDREGSGIDWAEVDTAEGEAREFAVNVTTRMLDAMRGELCRHVRAEWAGFDAICREETGLDAWTLLKGYEMPQDLIAEFQGLLSAGADGGNQGPDEAAVAQGVAFWREAIEGAREKQHAVAAD